MRPLVQWVPPAGETAGAPPQWVRSAGEGAVSFPRRGGRSVEKKGRFQSPPTYGIGRLQSPPDDQVEKWPTAHATASARGRVENEVDSGRPGHVVLVPGAVGNFPVVKWNKNQLSPENQLHTQLVSAHNQLQKSIPIAPIAPGT